jgi:transglutaminase-like putative cysteine protease
MKKSKVVKEKPVRWGDWLAALLLIIIMQIAAARLAATQWTKDLSLVQVLTFFGTILGLALGVSIFRRFWVGFLAFAYGIILIPWQLGLTLDHEIEWRERLLSMGGRLEIVLDELFTRKPITDNLLFLLLMGLLFWSLSIYAGFVLVRYAQPWKVVLPGGLAAFVIHSFDPLLVSRSWYLAFYLFFGLLLVARLVYLKYQAVWKEQHTHTPPDVGFDFIRFALLLAMILVFFAWNVPVVAETLKPAAEIWQTTTRPWLTLKDRFSFVFASLRASVGVVNNFYGDSLPLGLGSPLSNQVVLEIEAPTNPPNGARYYWQARVYGIYENNQWLTNIKTTREVTPDSIDLNQPGVDIRPVVTFTFFPHEALSNLFVVPQPLWVSRPSKAYMTVNPDGTVDFGAYMSDEFVRPGEQYVVRSALDAVTSRDLQAAGSDYPQWVLDSYLQLPNNITPRTRELARSIANGLTNPYDIVSAVTDYLRTNIEYNQSISAPPPNQERIDWFLFDYKQGFCNYYASAEVILLRSLGIPARMAVGFAQGERQIPPIEVGQNVPNEQLIETATYIVRQKDAHAWPEVFFPGIGWVDFEPTGGQPPLFRPSGDSLADLQAQQQRRGTENIGDQTTNPDNTGQQGPDSRDSLSNAGLNASFWTVGNIIKLFFLLIALFVLIYVIWQVRRGFKIIPFLERFSVEVPERLEKGMRRFGIRPPDFLINWIYYSKLPALSRSYMEINRALNRVGKPPAIQDTPSERTASLSSVLPPATDPAQRLLTEYQTAIYSPYTADPVVAREAGNEIRKLSYLAWLERILARFQEPSKR